MADINGLKLETARELIEQAHNAGNNWDYRRVYEFAEAALHQLEDTPGNDDLSATAHLLAGKGHTVQGQPMQAQEHYEKALQLLVNSGIYSRDYANGELGLAQCHLLRNDLGTAHLIWKRVLASAEKAGWKDMVAFILYQQGQAECNEDKIEEALPKFEQALALYSELGDVRRQYHIQLLVGFSMLQAGRLTDAHRLLTCCLEYYRENGPEVSLGSCLTNLGNVALLQGNFIQARECFQQCRELPEAEPHNIGFSALSTGVLDYLDGDLHLAYKNWMRARQAFEQANYRAVLIVVHALLAARSLYQGELQAAEDELQCAKRIGEEMGSAQDGLDIGVLAVWYLVQGGISQAQEAWDQFLTREALTRALIGYVITKLLNKLINGVEDIDFTPAATDEAQAWLSVLAEWRAQHTTR